MHSSPNQTSRKGQKRQVKTPSPSCKRIREGSCSHERWWLQSNNYKSNILRNTKTYIALFIDLLQNTQLPYNNPNNFVPPDDKRLKPTSTTIPISMAHTSYTRQGPLSIPSWPPVSTSPTWDKWPSYLCRTFCHYCQTGSYVLVSFNVTTCLPACPWISVWMWDPINFSRIPHCPQAPHVRLRVRDLLAIYLKTTHYLYGSDVHAQVEGVMD